MWLIKIVVEVNIAPRMPKSTANGFVYYTWGANGLLSLKAGSGGSSSPTTRRGALPP